MRQPVAGVLALAAAALDEPQVPPAALARLRLIVEQAEWLSQIISQGLETIEPPGDAGHRSDARHRNDARHRSDARQAVTEAVASAQLIWPGDLTLIAPPKAIYIAVHPVILRRSVANLLDNAMRAAGADGNIRVTAGSCPGWALIAIEDDGPGFGRIEKGHGLGLAAVTRIVIKHSGRVECTRSSLGGTCVSLWLPMITESGRRNWRPLARAAQAAGAVFRPSRPSRPQVAQIAGRTIRSGSLAVRHPPGGRLHLVSGEDRADEHPEQPEDGESRCQE